MEGEGREGEEIEGEEVDAMEKPGLLVRFGRGGGEIQSSSVRKGAPETLPGSVSSLSGHINLLLALKLPQRPPSLQIFIKLQGVCRPAPLLFAFKPSLLEGLSLLLYAVALKNSKFFKFSASMGYNPCVSFFHLTVEVSETHAEFLSESLYALGSLGQEWRESHLLSMPGIHAPPPGKMQIVSFFKTLHAAKKALRAAQNQWNAQLVALVFEEDKDWSLAWRKHIRATETQHLWVGPPWLEPSPGKHVLYVEPKMAFGTGDHPTTRLCLEEIDTFCSAFPKARVLDVGTGTGILGMAACKLGAHHALGTDNDSVALAHARENIQLNKIDTMQVSDAELRQIRESFELVVANIFANALAELAEELCKKTLKCLVISGILGPQSAELEMRFLQLGMQLDAKREFEEWVCLRFKPPGP